MTPQEKASLGLIVHPALMELPASVHNGVEKGESPVPVLADETPSETPESNPESNLDPMVMEEIRIEEEAVTESIEAYRKKLQDAGDRSNFTPEAMLLKRCIPQMAVGISEYVQGKKTRNMLHKATVDILGKADPSELAFIVLRTVVNWKVAEPLQRTAVQLAKDVEFHLRYQAFKKENPFFIKILNKALNTSNLGHKKKALETNFRTREEQPWEEWDERLLLQVGLVLLDILHKTTGIVEKDFIMKHKRGQKYKEACIRVSPTVERWLTSLHDQCEVLSSNRPPMIAAPLDWDITSNRWATSGAYYTNLGSRRTKLVKTRHKKNTVRIKEESKDLGRVLNGVNIIQKTAWKVNTPILAVAKQTQNNRGGQAGIPDLDAKSSIPVKPWGDMDKDNWEAFKKENADLVSEYCYRAKVAHDDWAKQTANRFTFYHQILRAQKFAKYQKIYFPHFLDWRGRIYPFSTHLNPQATDLGKALLSFAEGKPLGETGEFWLKVHCANQFGVDKVSFEDRVAWVEERKKELIRCGQDPFTNRFWMDADNPFKALAVCLELGELEKVGLKAFKSHIPVAMDGSCNSYQHYAAILRDPRAATLVNLSNNTLPGDIYMEVCKEVNAILEGENAFVRDFSDMASLWKGKVDRGICKRATMTTVYGVTGFGIAEQLIEEVRKREKSYLEWQGSLNKPCAFLGKVIEAAIPKVIQSTTRAMSWLQEVATIFGEVNTDIAWDTPSGFRVVQTYPKQSSKRIDTFFGGTRLRITLASDTPTIDKRGMRNALPPCYIHSMDAAHCLNTVLRANAYGIKDFALIHDSFGTHAAETGLLRNCLRETFVEQYQGNALAQFAEQVESQLPEGVTLPPIPEQGSFDVEEVLSSRYFFA